MIIVTVGTQLPFDRLIRSVDRIAESMGEPVLAQIGDGHYIPANMEWVRCWEPADFEAKIAQSRLIVAHAGIGSVLAAERHRKPLVLFPRRSALGEHRNDHQLATAEVLAQRRGVHLAHDEKELTSVMGLDLVTPVEATNLSNRASLLSALETFILDSTR